MLRKIHSLPGIFFAILLSITTATGAILAFDAFIESASAPHVSAGEINLAEMADRVAARFPDIEKITRTPSGRVRVTYVEDGLIKASMIDPVTSEPLALETASPALRMITNLHRAWLSGDSGRLVVGVSAFAMLILTLTGLVLLKRQLGGWLNLVTKIHGAGVRRWHLEIGRMAVAGLLLSSTTGLYLSLTGFEILPDGGAQHDALVAGSGGQRLPLKELKGLATLSLDDLREMTLPYTGDITDPITVKTNDAVRHVDAATGEIIREDAHDWAWQVHDLMFRLHTSKGMAWLSLFLGLSSAAGTALSLTGLWMWLRKRRTHTVIPGNVTAGTAEILVLVGSEGGTTWNFARSLHTGLTAAGCSVHIAAMNDLPVTASRTRRMIILTATAGSGEAPASASRFFRQLAQWHAPDMLEAIVLGFGDRQFPDFCGYAHAVENALRDHGIAIGMPTHEIDRQSAIAFTAWGQALAAHINLPIKLEYAPVIGEAYRFTLVSREDYGHDVQAPTTILRFATGGKKSRIARIVASKLGRAPYFSAGDLVAINPPGDQRPRYYSIASASRTGILEICVRKLPGGTCSNFLHGLVVGDHVEGTIRLNPGFHPDASRRPLILIGAGAGISPLVGFVRATGHQRPVHLYWGGRNPASDFLYRSELELHQSNGRLASWRTIFSRLPHGGYVQHLIWQDSAQLRDLIAAGAQILICGGREMADGVTQALTHIVAPTGLTLANLRDQGKLLEDVY